MDPSVHLKAYLAQIDQLRRLAESFWQRGWTPAGSGCFSMVIDRQPFRMLTTIGYSCRGQLQPADFCIVDDQAKPLDKSAGPNAEAAIHVWLAQQQPASVIVQTHSVWSSLLADRFGSLDGVLLEGHGLLQRLPDVESTAHLEWLPIAMLYDQTPLLEAIERTLKETPEEISRPPRAIVVQQHGMLNWADDESDVLHQTELFEYFCEYLVRRATLG